MEDGQEHQQASTDSCLAAMHAIARILQESQDMLAENGRMLAAIIEHLGVDYPPAVSGEG